MQDYLRPISYCMNKDRFWLHYIKLIVRICEFRILFNCNISIIFHQVKLHSKRKFGWLILQLCLIFIFQLLLTNRPTVKQCWNRVYKGTCFQIQNLNLLKLDVKYKGLQQPAALFCNFLSFQTTITLVVISGSAL